jgi:pyridoxal 5'-phosphate synthase pdxT subunit
VKIGILALQGAVGPHEEKLRAVGAEPVEVRTAEALEGLSGIILPGGESTTMLLLLDRNGLWEPLQRFVRAKPAWGVCAGTILLAREVQHPAQRSLGAIDIAVARNAFGRQKESFIAPLDTTPEWKSPLDGVFIRAPRITALGTGVKALLNYRGEPVMVEQGDRLASTFHPELTDDTSVHRYFLAKCAKSAK